MKAYKWEVKPLEVSNVKSSFFENEEIFPEGSVTFDNALLMKNIEHEWQSENSKRISTQKFKDSIKLLHI